jgi:hypothetical protein
MQQLKTGTGDAYAPLSEILASGRVAPFGQDDKQEVALLASVRMTNAVESRRLLTPPLLISIST